MKFLKFLCCILLLVTSIGIAKAEVNCTAIEGSYLIAKPGSNAYLWPGECIWSPARNFVLVMQTDGNLVLYDASNHKPAWATMTFAKPATLAMQDDGNLVVYHRLLEKYPGYSFTARSAFQKGSYFLAVQNDGNVVVYYGSDPGKSSPPIWSITAGILETKLGECSCYKKSDNTSVGGRDVCNYNECENYCEFVQKTMRDRLYPKYYGTPFCPG